MCCFDAFLCRTRQLHVDDAFELLGPYDDVWSFWCAIDFRRVDNLVVFEVDQELPVLGSVQQRAPAALGPLGRRLVPGSNKTACYRQNLGVVWFRLRIVNQLLQDRLEVEQDRVVPPGVSSSLEGVRAVADDVV